MLIVLKNIFIFVFITAIIQDGSSSKVSNYIYNEELKVLPAHAFKDYPSSTIGGESYILIQGSNLSKLEPEAFLNVFIETIDLACNDLKMLAKGIFVNVKVRNFYLNDNKIKTIQAGTFDDVYPYQQNGAFSLSLAGNRIKSIKKGIFKNLKIDRLFLQDNFINSIEKGSFEDMPKLKMLLLSNNLLDTISVGVFQNLGNNIHLKLTKNKIAFVSSKAFENNTNLHLYLDENKVNLRKEHFTNYRYIAEFVV